MEINIVKFEEIKHLQERIKFAVITFEKTNSLFFDKPEIRMEEFMEKWIEHFLLGKGDALLLARYLFERRNKPKILYLKDALRRSNFVIRRLKEFMGKYEKIDSSDFDDIKVEFNWIEDDGLKTTFLSRLNDLSQWDFATPPDIYNLVTELNILSLANANLYIIYLWRMSMSLWKIKGEVITKSIKSFFSTQRLRRDTKLQIGKLGFSKDYTIKSNTKSVISEENEEEEGESKINKVSIGQQVFIRLAEFLFYQKITLMPIIHSRIYDKVLDAKEYQLIKYRHFYQQLKDFGFSLSPVEKKSIEHVITPFLPGTMEVNSVLNLLSKLWINEPKPKPTRHMDYKGNINPIIF